MSSHNKSADIQRKVAYFQQLKARAFPPKKPVYTPPRFLTTARRPGMRGK